MEKTKSKKNKKDEVSKDVKTNSFVKGPRITEKSAVYAEKGIYTFNVSNSATKNEVKKAIKAMYNVVPTNVSITKIADKKVVRRGVVSTKRGGKKAVVHLKEGDKITFA